MRVLNSLANGRVIIFGSRRHNKCQEQDLFHKLDANGVNVEVWNKESLKSRKFNEVKDGDDTFVLIRNFFYSSFRGYNSPEDSEVIKRLRDLESRSTFLNTVDGLLLARDKIKSNDAFREAHIPHIKADHLVNHPHELVKWVNEASERYSNGVIIKDRFGGLGKGIIKVRKQGSLYLCDISSVVEGEQRFTNERFTSEELRHFFQEHMSGYDLMGQAYIASSYEFQEPGHSESIRTLAIGDKRFVSMARRAEGAINNVSLTKMGDVNGNTDITDTLIFEAEASKFLADKMGLFFVGNDFIRTDPSFYRGDSGALYVPSHLRGTSGVLPFMLESNGIPQYGGIQEMYVGKVDITGLIADSIKDRLE